MKAVKSFFVIWSFFLLLLFAGCAQKEQVKPMIKINAVTEAEPKQEITKYFYKKLGIKPVVKKEAREKALFEHGYDFFKKESINEKQ